MHHQFYVMPIIESIKSWYMYSVCIYVLNIDQKIIRPFLHIADLFTW